MEAKAAAPPTLQLTEGYRHARRLTSILCALTIAWGGAQFEFKALKFDLTGSIDLSGASLPIILICAITYAMTRCTLEFAMQPIEVRRWSLAQVDFKITVFLVRLTALILGAGCLYRSLETVLVVALNFAVLLISSGVFIFAGMLALMPLRIRLRRRNGLRNNSPVWAIAEAEYWAVEITVVILLALYTVLGAGFLYYEPLRALWTVPPSVTAVAIFVLTGIAVVISVYFQIKWSQELFAYEAPYTEERLPNGRIGIVFREPPVSTPPVQVNEPNT